jgi:hypothetical protein
MSISAKAVRSAFPKSAFRIFPLKPNFATEPDEGATIGTNYAKKETKDDQ